MKQRLLGASLVAVMFGTAVAWQLAVSIPGTIRHRLTSNSLSAVPIAIEVPELAYLRTAGGPRIHRVRLVAQNIRAIAEHHRIRLLIATYDTIPQLNRAELLVVGTDCVYRAPAGEQIRNTEYLTLLRSSACAPLTGTPTGQLRLELQLDGPARVALWTDEPSEVENPAFALVVADRLVPESSRRLAVRGLLEKADAANRASRAELLAYVWQVSASDRWIWIALGGSCALIWLAVVLLSADGNDAPPGAGRVVRSSAGGFCAAAALGLAYAVLVPPFQAADEPNHFIGFTEFIHRPNMFAEAEQLARTGHFVRIRFRPSEHFDPVDRLSLGDPLNIWYDATKPDPSVRGGAVQWLWRVFPKWMQLLPAPKLLLAMRLANVVVFATAVALFFGLVSRFCATRWPELFAIPIFLIPTLPFFAVMVSNYALLTAIYIVLAAGILIDFVGSRSSAVAGIIIGGTTAASVLISRSAFGLVLFVAAWIAGRLVVGRGTETARSTATYWVGLGTCIAAGLWVMDRPYVETIARYGSSRTPAWFARLLRLTLEHPGLALIPSAAAAAADYWMTTIRRCVAVSWVRIAILWLGRLAALSIVLMLATSAVLRYPLLAQLTPGVQPKPVEYAKSVVASGSTMFRIAHPDFLTSVSFWGGFGWLDTLLPAAFVSALATASGLACAALLLTLVRAGELRPLVRVAFGTAGYVASLAAYGFTIIAFTPADLHGRYLIGLYLAVLTIGWSSVPMLVERALHRLGSIRVACVFGFLLVHVLSIRVILTRYF